MRKSLLHIGWHWATPGGDAAAARQRQSLVLFSFSVKTESKCCVYASQAASMFILTCRSLIR